MTRFLGCSSLALPDWQTSPAPLVGARWTRRGAVGLKALGSDAA